MQYKYATQMPSLDCPPQCSPPSPGTVYRFVHQPFIDRDFQPSASWKDESKSICAAWGISLFTNETQARARFAKLLKKHSQIYKELGDHLASGSISPANGVATKPKSGHFDLYEWSESDLSDQFSTVVGKLL
jgi:hypothetical protein